MVYYISNLSQLNCPREIQLTLNNRWVGVKTICIVQYASIVDPLYLVPLYQLLLHNWGSASEDSTNRGLCNTAVFIIGKYPYVRGLMQFKPVLFKGQLYLEGRTDGIGPDWRRDFKKREREKMTTLSFLF